MAIRPFCFLFSPSPFIGMGPGDGACVPPSGDLAQRFPTGIRIGVAPSLLGKIPKATL